VVQIRLPAKFLVEYDTQNTSRRARVNCRSGQSEGAGVVVFCFHLGEVHKDILLWGKRCSMPSGPLQELLMDSLQCSSVLLCGFAKSLGVHVVNEVGPRGWESQGVAGFDAVGIAKKGDDWQQ
jgi:hypothetical protein